MNATAKDYIAALEPRWYHPVDNPPPRGVKLMMLNPGGILCLGNWPSDDSMACWAPLLKVDPDLKERLRQEGRLR